MKNLFFVGFLAILFSSCGNNIEEQKKAKMKEYSKYSDEYQSLLSKSIKASQKSSDAKIFWTRLRVAGAEENDPKCKEAKKEEDKFLRESDSLKKEAEVLKKTKLDVLMREIDSLNKLK